MLTTSLILAAFTATISARVTERSYAFEPASSLHRRLTGQSIAFACFGGGGDCECPSDKNGDSGVLINVFPGYQCAYPNGACSWSDKTGALFNTAQTNCPSSAPCPSSGVCSCPHDLRGDTGVLINQFTGYQCAYPNGACTWDFEGNLENRAQTNCVESAKCKQSGIDS